MKFIIKAREIARIKAQSLRTDFYFLQVLRTQSSNRIDLNRTGRQT